jgi:hypothetical protein
MRKALCTGKSPLGGNNHSYGGVVLGASHRSVVVGGALGSLELTALDAGLTGTVVDGTSGSVAAGAEDREERLAKVLLEQEGGNAVGGEKGREHPDVGGCLDGRPAVAVPTTDGKGGSECLSGNDTNKDEVTAKGGDGADVGEYHENDTPRGELGEVGVETDGGQDTRSLEEPNETSTDVERAPHGVEDGREIVAGLEALDASDELGNTTPHHDEGEEDVGRGVTSPPIGDVGGDDPGAAGIAGKAKHGRGGNGL